MTVALFWSLNYGRIKNYGSIELPNLESPMPPHGTYEGWMWGIVETPPDAAQPDAAQTDKHAKFVTRKD